MKTTLQLVRAWRWRVWVALCACALLPAGAARAYPWPLPQAIVQAPALPDLPNGAYVTARDGGASFRFGAPAVNVFTFGDTPLSAPNAEGLQWCTNTMFATSDLDGDGGISDPFNYPYFAPPLEWVGKTQAEKDYNDANRPVSFFGFWPTTPFVVGGRTYQFFDKIKEIPDKPQFENIEPSGSGFYEVTGLDVTTSRIRHWPENAGNDHILFTPDESFGDMVAIHDGYVYTYGTIGFGDVRIARAPIANDAFKYRGSWTFLGQDGAWTNSSAQLASIMPQGDGGIGSLDWNGYLNCWLYTYMAFLGDQVQVRVADNPAGPWSPPTHVYRGLRSQDGQVPYFARAHKILEKENGRTIFTSYSVAGTATGSRIPFSKIRFGSIVAGPPLGRFRRVIARHSGKALDVSWGSTAEGAAVWQWPYTGNNAQQWLLEDADPATPKGFYKIKVRHSNKYLSVDLSGVPWQQWNNPPNGTGVVQAGYAGAATQQWTLVDRGGGYYALRSRAGGRVLEIAGASSADAARAQIWDDLEGTNQQWRLTAP